MIELQPLEKITLPPDQLEILELEWLEEYEENYLID